MKENIIYVKTDEEITSVADKLIESNAKEIFLVIPKGSAIGQSLVNLKLLKREADNLGKKITIVTQEETLQRLAKKTDFLVAESLENPKTETDEEAILSEQISADDFEDLLKEERRPGPLSMVDIVKSDRVGGAKLLARKVDVISKMEPGPTFKKDKAEKEPVIKIYKNQDRVPRKTEQIIKTLGETAVPSFSIKIFGIFILAALVIAGLMFFLVLPKAEVFLTPRSEKTVVDMSVLADKNASVIDSSLNKIPAQLIKIEDRLSSEFLTTGERQLNEKARGKITVFNAYSSSPQALVETTRFLSEDGKIFRLTKTIIIPGAKIEEGQIVPSSIEVEVEADEVGSSYNIGPTSFTIPGFKGSPKYNGFYGRSNSQMSGGSTEKVKVLTQEDFDKAKEGLWNNLRDKIKKEASEQTSEEFKLFEEAVSIQMAETKSSVEIGAKAENFTLNIKGAGKVLVFSQNDIIQLLKKDLAIEPEGKKELIVNNNSLNYKNIKADFDKGQLSFKVQGEQEVVWKVDEQEIKEMIVGKSEEEIRQIFSQRPEVEKIKVSLWPFWVKKITTQTDRIKITVD